MSSAYNKKEFLKNFSPPHHREDWDRSYCCNAFVHTKLSILRGTENGCSLDKKEISSLYNKAKLKCDFDAAYKLIDLVWDQSIEEKLLEFIEKLGKYPIIAFPHPGFDDDDSIDHDAGSRLSSKNALPFAYASRLQAAFKGIENISVKQASRVGRSKLKRFPRFLFQPSFTGIVDQERPYILVDDTLTLGGTLAVMRSYIVRNEGTVIAVSALTHSLGKDIAFALRAETYRSLLKRYGLGLVDFWKEKIGHEAKQLTDAEAKFLCEWESGAAGNQKSLLHALRTRLDRAGTTCG